MDTQHDQDTIMVVDDTPANLTLITEMLQGQNFRVVAFPSGKMALAAAEKRSPDLILLDVNMPGMNGYEVCEHLKTNPTLQDIPVLFISALTDTADKVKAFSVGAVDYVTKPFQFEETIARVKTHLRLRRLQIELNQQNLHLEELVKKQVAEISDSQLATIVALATLAESRDDTTGIHIERTRILCKLLAQELQRNPTFARSITSAFIETIFYSAPLHDIGKVGIPDSILLKPGKLTMDEFEIMKAHTTIGASTLQSAHQKYPRNALLNMGIAVARSHHEKWDGSGYPDGLTGEDIPLSARIMAVVDVYDALRAKRPYKPAFTHQESVEIIQSGSGYHFDPLIVEGFMAVESNLSRIEPFI